eukprot:gb/GECG01014536.1/.p1 GENE.gb/GECG01014536.1/~~gb/GECG01014536.1/.p1  ORF type:complete len:268 (+),score=48.14 gb/GECG01014536.1/:1-804(+)
MSDNKSRALELKSQGNQHFKNGENEKAIQKYTEAIELYPHEHTFYSNRSMVYAAQKQWEEAAADGRKCIELDPKFLKGYHRLAHPLKELQQYKEAVQILEKGLVQYPDNQDLRKLLNETRPLLEKQERERRAKLQGPEKLKEEGNDLFKDAKFEQAIEVYGQCIEKCSENDTKTLIAARNNRAACYQQLSDFQSVVDDTTAVLELDPKNLKALLRRGLALEGLEKFRAALADIREVLMIDPKVDVANRAQHRLGQAVRELKKQNTQI